jgi:hypothetical protein
VIFEPDVRNEILQRRQRVQSLLCRISKTSRLR